MDLYEAERIVGDKANTWPGRCAEIASKLASAVGGASVYGHWLGPPGEFYAGRSSGFIQHGWIEMPDGSVVDPTRFVFEDMEPYIFEGTDDEGFYDRGGNKLRERRMTTPPEFTEDGEVHTMDFRDDVLTHVEGLLHHPGPWLTSEQALWLANLPVSVLGAYARPIYTELQDAGLGAFIPIDNERMVLG